MSETILIGRGSQFSAIARNLWEEQLSKVPGRMKIRLSFMTKQHHLVRYFVVRALPRVGRPIPPEMIAAKLKISLKRVNAILAELEERLFFLVRDKQGSVLWAYPVTAEATRHRLRFSTGEEIYAAWAEDAIAAPFVQGRLRKKKLSIEVLTECAHCERPMRLVVGSNLKNQIVPRGAKPLIFEPEVDWANFVEPNIIHAYWRNSLFFWSEEHAMEFRQKWDQVDGAYLTLEQSAYSSRIAQGALFAF